MFLFLNYIKIKYKTSTFHRIVSYICFGFGVTQEAKGFDTLEEAELFEKELLDEGLSSNIEIQYNLWDLNYLLEDSWKSIDPWDQDGYFYC